MKQIILWIIFIFCGLGLTFGQQRKSDKVPLIVTKAFSVKFPSIQKVAWEQEDVNVYEAEYMENGQEHSVLFDLQGNWIRTETELKNSELPTAIQNALASHFPGFKLEEVEKIEDPLLGTYYTFEIENRKEEYHMSYKENGELIRKTAD